MFRYGICQELFEGWEWVRQCEFIAKTGYQGIELAPFTVAPVITELSALERRELRTVAQAHGLEIFGFHWLLAKTTGLHLTTANRAVRNATSEYLKHLGDACADLGGMLMVLGSPKQRDIEPGMSREQAVENACEVLSAALPAIGSRNVQICLEPLTTAETNFLNSCAEAVDLIKRVGQPNLVLHQDVKAMLGESEPIPVLINRFASVTGHFHVNDSNLLGPGMGSTNYRPIFESLVATRYSHWISVEVFDYSPGAQHIAEFSLKFMQDLEQEVRGACKPTAE